MSLKFDFTKKTVLITGGAQGIGHQMVKDFLGDGANVVVWDYNQEAIDRLLSEFAQYGDRLHAKQVDVSSRDAVSKAATALRQKIHILINNAGITRDRTFAKLELDDVDRVIQTNLLSAFYVTKNLLPHFDTESKACRVINISSVVGVQGNFGQANYAASKAGLLGMTRTLAKEMARKGFTVNAVAPGFIDTTMAREIPEASRQMVIDKTPVGRFGYPEEISAACRYLASNEAAYINGTCLEVDGGISL